MEGANIASGLRDVADACATLRMDMAGSLAIAFARGIQPQPSHTDATNMIPMLCAAAANVRSESSSASSPVGRLLWTITAAIDAALRSTDASDTSPYVKEAIENAYLPLLDPGFGLELHQIEQVVRAAVATIERAGAWAIVLQLLKQYCCIGQLNSNGGPDNASIPSAGVITLCARFLEAATDVSNPSQHAVLCCASDEVFPAALNLLTSSTIKTTPAIAALGQSLLPAALGAAQHAQRLAPCLTLLWQICSRLGCSKVPADCRIGLALLVQFSRPLLQHGAIAQDAALWSLLLRALSSDQGINRKRALHVLELAVAQLQEDGNTEAGQISAWNAFIKLYSTVNDTSLHLFKEAWPQVDRLHLPETSLPLELSTSDNAIEIDCIVKLPLSWVLLLWRMALEHRHIAAQKIAALTFLQRAWPPEVLAELPPSFSAEVLLPILGQPVLQRGDLSDEIQNLVLRFFQNWSAALPMEKRGELLLGLLSTMAGAQQQQSIITFAAKALVAATTLEELASAPPLLNKDLQAEFLKSAAAAAAAQPGYGANIVAMKVYLALVSAATTCIVIDSLATLVLVTKWLDAVPLALLQPGGLIQGPLLAWLRNKQQGELMGIFGDLLHGYSDYVYRSGGFEMDYDVSAFINEGKSVSPREVAVAALVVCETDESRYSQISVGAAMSPWSVYMTKSSVSVDTGLPLLMALLAASTSLTGGAPAPTSALQIYMIKILIQIVGTLTSGAERHMAWLATMTESSALTDLERQITAACVDGNISPEAAFNKDSVLPASYLSNRQTSLDSLQCIAGAARLLESTNNRGLEVKENAVATAAKFVVMCAEIYPRLFAEYPPATSSREEDVGAHALNAQRARLEVAISLLRPLVACSTHAVCGISESEDVASAAVSLIGSLLDALQIVAANTPESQAKEPARKKKRKNSVKLEPLTLHSWTNLLSWRAIDGLLGAVSLQTLPVELQSRIFVAAVYGLATAPEGSNALIPFIRCVRALLPLLVQNHEAFVPAVLASTCQTSATAMASLSSSSTQAVESKVSVPANASLDAVIRWMGEVLIAALSLNTRKRTGMAAAVLSCCLHPCLFQILPKEGADQPTSLVWALHQEGGAVRDLVQQLKGIAIRHSRLLALFSTQFAALLAAYPEFGSLYVEFIVQLARIGFEDDSNLRSLVSK